jgi:hypothetical protein
MILSRYSPITVPLPFFKQALPIILTLRSLTNPQRFSPLPQGRLRTVRDLNVTMMDYARDFLFRVCYALLIPAQRVDHGRNTRGIRV